MERNGSVDQVRTEQAANVATQKFSSPRRGGRKPADERRADELRERLVKWSYFPASARPSLRALAKACRPVTSYFHTTSWVWKSGSETGMLPAAVCSPDVPVWSGLKRTKEECI
jgi:hypothetical protein